jgi:two-component system, OmpR family, response regulator
MIHHSMPRLILIVDDDPHIRQLLAFALAKAGFDTIEAEDGEAALAVAESRMPDLLVLDINMPRMDGIETCRRLRARSDLPILFLSSRDDEIDRVLGIELGADDYVTKPFSPREVVARVTAILRRTTARASADADASAPLSHGRVQLDPDGWQARWAGQLVPLTATEFGILRTLAAMPSKVFSRDAIIETRAGIGYRMGACGAG